MAWQPFVGPCPLFQFLDLFTQSVGPLGQGISPSLGRYLHIGQHKRRIRVHRHPCFNGIRTLYPSVWADEDSSCLRLCDHFDRLWETLYTKRKKKTRNIQEREKERSYMKADAEGSSEKLVIYKVKRCRKKRPQLTCSLPWKPQILKTIISGWFLWPECVLSQSQSNEMVKRLKGRRTSIAANASPGTCSKTIWTYKIYINLLVTCIK
jgi:hypothetical protein